MNIAHALSSWFALLRATRCRSALLWRGLRCVLSFLFVFLRGATLHRSLSFQTHAQRANNFFKATTFFMVSHNFFQLRCGDILHSLAHVALLLRRRASRRPRWRRPSLIVIMRVLHALPRTTTCHCLPVHRLSCRCLDAHHTRASS